MLNNNLHSIAFSCYFWLSSLYFRNSSATATLEGKNNCLLSKICFKSILKTKLLIHFIFLIKLFLALLLSAYMNFWWLCCCILNNKKKFCNNFHYMTRLKNKITFFSSKLRLEKILFF